MSDAVHDPVSGITNSTLRLKSQGLSEDTGNPLFIRDMNRCIRCGRCVRACNELRGVHAIDYTRNAQGNVEIRNVNALTPSDKCRYCTACVEVCPTGALRDKEETLKMDALTREDRLVPCQADCPAHIDVPAYIRAIREGRPGDAVAIIREKVPFPLVLGHICNHLCETECRRKNVSDPMGIRNLKRYAVEHDEAQAWKKKGYQLPDSGKRVAIVGSGPCGLTAAYYLRKKGHAVTVYERRPLPGGPMTSGIPAYRLPLEGVLDEIGVIEETGVKILTDTEIKDITPLRAENDAVLVAVGVSYGKKLPIPGSDLPEVFTALEVLADNRADKDISYLGKKVIVIGSGSVSYDVARSLVRRRLDVTMACLEQADKLLADQDDQKEGAEEGINLLPGRSFEEIENKDGHVSGLRVHTVLSSTYDRATGKVTEVALEGSQTTIPCDSVIFATGQHTGLLQYENFGIKLNFRGFPENNGFNTSEDGVFAAGDAITGISFVIKAIEQGREVAAEIDRYLGGDGDISETLLDRERDPEIGTIDGFADLKRVPQELYPAAERAANYEDVYRTYSSEEAACESTRCLQCDLRTCLHAPKKWSDFENVG